MAKIDDFDTMGNADWFLQLHESDAFKGLTEEGTIGSSGTKATDGVDSGALVDAKGTPLALKYGVTSYPAVTVKESQFFSTLSQQKDETIRSSIYNRSTFFGYGPQGGSGDGFDVPPADQKKYAKAWRQADLWFIVGNSTVDEKLAHYDGTDPSALDTQIFYQHNYSLVGGQLNCQIDAVSGGSISADDLGLKTDVYAQLTAYQITKAAGAATIPISDDLKISLFDPSGKPFVENSLRSKAATQAGQADVRFDLTGLVSTMQALATGSTADPDALFGLAIHGILAGCTKIDFATMTVTFPRDEVEGFIARITGQNTSATQRKETGISPFGVGKPGFEHSRAMFVHDAGAKLTLEKKDVISNRHTFWAMDGELNPRSYHYSTATGLVWSQVPTPFEDSGFIKKAMILKNTKTGAVELVCSEYVIAIDGTKAAEAGQKEETVNPVSWLKDKTEYEGHGLEIPENYELPTESEIKKFRETQTLQIEEKSELGKSTNGVGIEKRPISFEDSADNYEIGYTADGREVPILKIWETDQRIEQDFMNPNTYTNDGFITLPAFDGQQELSHAQIAKIAREMGAFGEVKEGDKYRKVQIRCESVNAATGNRQYMFRINTGIFDAAIAEAVDLKDQIATQKSTHVSGTPYSYLRKDGTTVSITEQDYKDIIDVKATLEAMQKGEGYVRWKDSWVATLRSIFTDTSSLYFVGAAIGMVWGVVKWVGGGRQREKVRQRIEEKSLKHTEDEIDRAPQERTIRDKHLSIAEQELAERTASKASESEKLRQERIMSGGATNEDITGWIDDKCPDKVAETRVKIAAVATGGKPYQHLDLRSDSVVTLMRSILRQIRSIEENGPGGVLVESELGGTGKSWLVEFLLPQTLVDQALPDGTTFSELVRSGLFTQVELDTMLNNFELRAWQPSAMFADGYMGGTGRSVTYSEKYTAMQRAKGIHVFYYIDEIGIEWNTKYGDKALSQHLMAPAGTGKFNIIGTSARENARDLFGLGQSQRRFLRAFGDEGMGAMSEPDVKVELSRYIQKEVDGLVGKGKLAKEPTQSVIDSFIESVRDIAERRYPLIAEPESSKQVLKDYFNDPNFQKLLTDKAYCETLGVSADPFEAKTFEKFFSHKTLAQTTKAITEIRKGVKQIYALFGSPEQQAELSALNEELRAKGLPEFNFDWKDDYKKFLADLEINGRNATDHFYDSELLSEYIEKLVREVPKGKAERGIYIRKFLLLIKHGVSGIEAQSGKGGRTSVELTYSTDTMVPKNQRYYTSEGLVVLFDQVINLADINEVSSSSLKADLDKILVAVEDPTNALFSHKESILKTLAEGLLKVKGRIELVLGAIGEDVTSGMRAQIEATLTVSMKNITAPTGLQRITSPEPTRAAPPPPPPVVDPVSPPPPPVVDPVSPPPRLILAEPTIYAARPIWNAEIVTSAGVRIASLKTYLESMGASPEVKSQAIQWLDGKYIDGGMFTDAQHALRALWADKGNPALGPELRAFANDTHRLAVAKVPYAEIKRIVELSDSAARETVIRAAESAARARPAGTASLYREGIDAPPIDDSVRGQFRRGLHNNNVNLFGVESDPHGAEWPQKPAWQQSHDRSIATFQEGQYWQSLNEGALQAAAATPTPNPLTESLAIQAKSDATAWTSANEPVDLVVSAPEAEPALPVSRVEAPLPAETFAESVLRLSGKVIPKMPTRMDAAGHVVNLGVPMLAVGAFELALSAGEEATGVKLSQDTHTLGDIAVLTEAVYQSSSAWAPYVAKTEAVAHAAKAGLPEAAQLVAGEAAAKTTLAQITRLGTGAELVIMAPIMAPLHEAGAEGSSWAVTSLGATPGGYIDGGAQFFGGLGLSLYGGMKYMRGLAAIDAAGGIAVGGTSVAVTPVALIAGGTYLLAEAGQMQHNQEVETHILMAQPRIDNFAIELLNTRLEQAGSGLTYDYDSLRGVLAEWGVDDHNYFISQSGLPFSVAGVQAQGERVPFDADQEVGHRILKFLAETIQSYYKNKERMTDAEFVIFKQEQVSYTYQFIEDLLSDKAKVAMANLLQVCLGKAILHKSHYDTYIVQKNSYSTPWLQQQAEDGVLFKDLLQGIDFSEDPAAVPSPSMATVKASTVDRVTDYTYRAEDGNEYTQSVPDEENEELIDEEQQLYDELYEDLYREDES